MRRTRPKIHGGYGFYRRYAAGLPPFMGLSEGSRASELFEELHYGITIGGDFTN